MNLMKISDITSEIGFRLLTHGAAINRVEDTICRIAAAYGMKADVFAIPSSLVLTITDSELRTFTITRRVYYRDLNLDRVDMINTLAREICRDKPDYTVVSQKLEEISSRPVYSQKMQLLAAAVTSGGFAILFGGGFPEAAAAAVIGIIVRWLFCKVEQLQGGILLSNIIGGAACAFLSILSQQLFAQLDPSVLTISTLMLLVPGLTMTNSMRDLIAGDLVTGVMKATEAIIIATGIAIGVVFVLALSGTVAGVIL